MRHGRPKGAVTRCADPQAARRTAHTAHTQHTTEHKQHTVQRSDMHESGGSLSGYPSQGCGSAA
eukprot:2295370-Prymnesium_polylepis.1